MPFPIFILINLLIEFLGSADTLLLAGFATAFFIEQIFFHILAFLIFLELVYNFDFAVCFYEVLLTSFVYQYFAFFAVYHYEGLSRGVGLDIGLVTGIHHVNVSELICVKGFAVFVYLD
jgi:hypothetical protein